MNILVPDSWLREYLDTKATSIQLKDCLSLCGPSIERVNKVEGDIVYDVEITSNRVDMASVYGIAREAAAILPRFGIGAKLNPLTVPPAEKPVIKLPMDVSDLAQICNRIVAVVMEVDPMKPSPNYIRDRLEKSGVRSLNNLVDITNYIMLETGHPSHVFDYDRVKTHTFIIRRAKGNEPLITLDNKKFLLNEEDVIIDDGTGRVIDLPGIMGTENSVVTQSTKRIIFFIESNNPVLIRKTSMHYGIRTMAASINEKHPDPELVMTTFLKGIQLYQKIAGGKVVSSLIDIYPNKPKPKTIHTTVEFINQRIGVDLTPQEITSILTSLSFDVKVMSGSHLEVTPPTYRQFDVLIPEDVVEEVARIYGYHNLQSEIMDGDIPVTAKPADLPVEAHIKTMLKYTGFTECYHYSFTSKETIEKAGLDVSKHLKVANPLTPETEYMRTSLIPSLLTTLDKNKNLKESFSFFELAKVYMPRPNNLPHELTHLVLVETSDFPHLKGIVENVLADLGIKEYSAITCDNPFLHPGQSSCFTKDKKEIVSFGKLHPKIAANFQLNHDVYIAQFSVEKLVSFFSPVKKYTPIPLYPPAFEDLSISYPSQTKIADIIGTIAKTSTLVKDVKVIDRYQQTTTLRITYQSNEKNLTSDDIQPVRHKILSNLETKLHAKLKQ